MVQEPAHVSQVGWLFDPLTVIMLPAVSGKEVFSPQFSNINVDHLLDGLRKLSWHGYWDFLSADSVCYADDLVLLLLHLKL